MPFVDDVSVGITARSCVSELRTRSMHISRVSVVPSYVPVTPRQDQSSVQSAGQGSDQAANPSPASFSPAPASAQFDTQLLTALLGSQTIPQSESPGEQGVTAKVLSNIKTQFEDVTGVNPGSGPATDIFSSAGSLTSDELEGQSTTSLANDLVGTFGSNGSLSQSDVNQALGISSTAPPLMLKVISDNWDSLAGGSQSMTTTQLSAAIQKYVLGGDAVGSGAS